MTKKQVITIEKDGTISGLQVKPGKGVDLTKLGRAQVERVSEILWDGDWQGWYVQPINGPFAGHPITYEMWRDVMGEDAEDPKGAWSSEEEAEVILFSDYDEAVTCEIAFLDAHRTKGRF